MATDPRIIPFQCNPDPYLTQEHLEVLSKSFNTDLCASLPSSSVFSHLVNGVRQVYMAHLLVLHQKMIVQSEKHEKQLAELRERYESQLANDNRRLEQERDTLPADAAPVLPVDDATAEDTRIFDAIESKPSPQVPKQQPKVYETNDELLWDRMEKEAVTKGLMGEELHGGKYEIYGNWPANVRSVGAQYHFDEMVKWEAFHNREGKDKILLLWPRRKKGEVGYVLREKKD